MLPDELRDLDAQIETARTRAAELTKAQSDIHTLLEQKQSEITFRDFIAHEGRKEVRSLLAEEVKQSEESYIEKMALVQKARETIRALKNAKRVKEIKKTFKQALDKFLAALGVLHFPSDKYKNVYAQVKESGSDLPRAILAYVFAVLHTIHRNSTAVYCPVVIDSPKQQDQDDDNWLKILTFLRDNQPDDTQLILSVVDDRAVSFGGRVEEMTERYHALSLKEYEAVSKELKPLIDATMAD